MKFKGRLAYFAHSMAKYNTKDEKEQLEFLRKVFLGTVICPNNNLGEMGSMKPYLDVVSKVDVLFVAEFNGFIGTGVRKEINEAQKHKTPVFVLRMEDREYTLKEFRKVLPLKPINQNTFFSAKLQLA